MPRIDLQVPFPQKDEAKRLGARWDVALKKWYVPDGVDCTAFDQWLPKPPPPPNMRAPFWYLAVSTRACWHCKAISHVFAIMLPPGNEVLTAVEDESGDACADDAVDDCWKESEDSTLLSYITDVPESVAAQLRQRAPRYHADSSQTIQSTYWMNHCEHCKAKLGDFETVEEVGTFDGQVELAQIDEPFAAACGGHTLFI